LTAQEQCSQCNATITSTDKYCPECGGKIDWGIQGGDDLSTFFSKKETSPKKKTRGGKFVCDFCGHSNSKSASYCESCGAILSLAHSADENIAEEVQLLFHQPSQPMQEEPKKSEEISSHKPKSVSKEKQQEQKIETSKIFSEEKEHISSYPFEQKLEKKSPHVSPDKLTDAEEVFAKEQVNLVTQKNVASWKIYLALVVLFLLVLFFISFFNEQKTVVPPSQQQSKPALQHLQQLEAEMQAHPNDAEMVLRYANALHDAQMFPQAIATYNNYLALNSNNPDALVDLGICYFETNDAAAAIMQMKKAIALQSNHQKAHFNIGIISLNTGDAETAKEYFQKAAQLDAHSETGKRANELLQTHFQQ
jgi:cytochrome c-type biogenesis protein CcmH/NrfG